MSSANVTYAPSRRVDRATQQAAAKAKRQKLILAGIGGLFVLLLVIQVPRTLEMLSPAEVAAPPVAVPAPVAVPSTTPAAPAVSPETKAQLERIEAQYAAKDPFVNRTDGVPTPKVGIRGAPGGARDPFVPRRIGGATGNVGVVSGGAVRDPFAPMARAAAPPAGETPPPPPVEETQRINGYTIVLASIRVEAGRETAARAAVVARSRGVKDVGVLRSSDYATLRPGYFVVFSQVFESRAQAQRALAAAQAAGYDRSYVRPLGG